LALGSFGVSDFLMTPKAAVQNSELILAETVSVVLALASSVIFRISKLDRVRYLSSSASSIPSSRVTLHLTIFLQKLLEPSVDLRVCHAFKSHGAAAWPRKLDTLLWLPF
jgi:hypothetical protein